MTKNNTKVLNPTSDRTSVFLHGTEVFRKENNKITLNSGGWMTTTTKKRMNEASAEFAKGSFSVSQKAGQWFVRYLHRFEQGDLTRPTSFDSFAENEEIPSPDDTCIDWKTIPFVDGITFELPK